MNVFNIELMVGYSISYVLNYTYFLGHIEHYMGTYEVNIQPKILKYVPRVTILRAFLELKRRLKNT